MKWISDRNPTSPGMYLVNPNRPDRYPERVLCYFDGKGWEMQFPFDSMFSYYAIPEWAVMKWGKDE